MDFTNYQPAEPTASAISAALIRVNADIPLHIQRENAAKATRDALLIDGDRKALAAAETELQTVRADAERLEAVADQLARRLVAAEQHEAVTAVNSSLAEVSTANVRANAFWKKNGVKLRALLDEASDIVVTRDAAASRARQLRNTAFDRFPEVADQLAASHGGALIDDVVFAEWREVLNRTIPAL